jgi:murein L,D-transpeptidase YafK
MFRILALLVLITPGLTLAQQADRLPAYLLQVPASVAAIFVAETGTSTFHRFDTGASAAGPRDERYMSVGQNGVGKQRAWDRRTPLGIYFISEELDTSGLHERYGPLAFPLDYPNVWDRANQRSGDGIWIHGAAPDAGRRPPLDTDGCIALPNDELLDLQEQFVPLVTPVIITRQIRWLSPEQVSARRDEVNAILERWAESYRSGDLYGYLSLYAEDFGYRGMTREEWASYRIHSVSGTPLSEFSLSEILLLADPEDESLYLSRFRQTIVDDERTITTIKRLYWRRTAAGELKIVAEDNG